MVKRPPEIHAADPIRELAGFVKEGLPEDRSTRFEEYLDEAFDEKPSSKSPESPRR